MRQFLIRLGFLLFVSAFFGVVFGGVDMPAHAFPGSAISAPGSTGATPVSVTSASALSGGADQNVTIDAAFTGAITLPAASTRRGQTITITDAVGAGSGAADSSTTNLMYVVVSNTGTETITGPNIATGRTRLLLWKRYGTITLRSNGSTQWYATNRQYWHVDPRTISGIKAWYDSRYGITISSNLVTNMLDLSGASVDLAQGNAGDRPRLERAAFAYFGVMGSENSINFTGSTMNLTSIATPAFSSGAVTVFSVYARNWSTTSASETGVLIQSALTATLGFRFSPYTGLDIAGATVATAGSWFIQGGGTNGVAPYASGIRAPQTTNSRRTVQMATVGATAGLIDHNGQAEVNLLSGGLAVPSFTQALRYGNSFIGRSQEMIVFDALPVSNDVQDLFAALTETFGPF